MGVGQYCCKHPFQRPSTQYTKSMRAFLSPPVRYMAQLLYLRSPPSPSICVSLPCPLGCRGLMHFEQTRAKDDAGTAGAGGVFGKTVDLHRGKKVRLRLDPRMRDTVWASRKGGRRVGGDG